MTSISLSSWWRSIVPSSCRIHARCAVALLPGARPRRASRCSCTPRWRCPVHTSGSERPSSACQSSGGRSSSATTIPTWLTGLLVTVWIARSASERPRKSQMSPVAAVATASSSATHVPRMGRNLRGDAAAVEAHRPCGRRRRGGDRRRARAPPARRRAPTTPTRSATACTGASPTSPRPTKTRQLDRRAAVHDDAEARGARPLGRGLVDHAELEPHARRADRDRLVDVRAGRLGAAEDVDDLDARSAGIAATLS